MHHKMIRFVAQALSVIAFLSVLAIPALGLPRLQPIAHAANLASESAYPTTLELSAVAQLSSPSVPGLEIHGALTNHTTNDISFQAGCGAAPALILHSQSTGAVFRVQPATPQITNSCRTRAVIIHPGTSVTLLNQYRLTGYTQTPAIGLGSIPNDSYDARLQLTYTVLTGNPTQRYRKASDGHVV